MKRLGAFLLLAMAAATSAAAQTGPPRKIRSVGKTEVFYNPATNETNASTHEKLMEWLAKDGGRDETSLYVSFTVLGPRPVEPATVDLTIVSSLGRIEFRGNHRLTITADGKQILSADMKDEILSYYRELDQEFLRLIGVKYEILRTIINAKKVTFQIGHTSVNLAPTMLQALGDLERTIER